MTATLEILTVDPDSHTPLHRQVYDGIRHAILGGSLVPGERLPASRVLAEELGVSRATISEAFNQLTTEGYVVGRHGSGTFVAPELPDERATALHAHSGPLGHGQSLSRWGLRVLAEEVSSSGRADEYRYDFRPHQVARDAFPWDAWRSCVDEALFADRTSLLRMAPVTGHAPLREAISNHVATYRGVRCTPEVVVVVNGVQQGLNLLAQILLEPGDPVVVEDPGYPAARMALETRDLNVMRVPVDDDGLRVDTLVALPSPRLVHVTPSHQDPTGATMSLARRLALLEVAHRCGALIVEDDYDSEFRYEGRPVESLQGLDRSGQVVYAGTFSKSVLPSLRVGFLILPPRLLVPFLSAKALWDGGTPVLEQAALARFMVSGEMERHIRRMRRLYRSRRDVMVRAFLDTFGATVTVGERHGGLNVLVSLDCRLDEERIIATAHNSGIGLRSAREYYAQPPRRPTFLIGFAGSTEDDIRAGIRLLCDAMR